ncbi:MAG: hypothetical protein IJ352_05740 [Muribaculaceae bacterium]|nr:hypothetical protein [Muribaculaceae bacterium]
MISEAIKKAILNKHLLFRATRFYFYEIGVGNDEGDTDAEFLISVGGVRSHFEIHGINEKYIKSNFNIENQNKVLRKNEDIIEIIFDWRPSKNSENEPTSLDFVIRDNKIVKLKFWFMAGSGLNAHIRTIIFDVKDIYYCNQCYNTFDIDLLSGEYVCPFCGNKQK